MRPWSDNLASLGRRTITSTKYKHQGFASREPNAGDLRTPEAQTIPKIRFLSGGTPARVRAEPDRRPTLPRADWIGSDDSVREAPRRVRSCPIPCLRACNWTSHERPMGSRDDVLDA